jgi:flavin reductase (DIM6/NTAB) family NADH-FMN oxidoreductase RutF
MEIDAGHVRASVLYQHMLRVIAPRPIAWVSTVSVSGTDNLAPFSFFTGVGSRPPTVLFCPANRRDGDFKDTLKNIIETQEFVVNVVPFQLATEMNLSSLELSSEESEFDLTGLATSRSVTVKAPGVAASPVRLECRLLQHLALDDGPGGANIVVGKVLHLHLADDVLDSAGYADPDLLNLIGRMGGQSYCRTTTRFDLSRPGN